jgi:uncharacterized membrane protein YgaE (UPF0421/DUF939 family)
MEARAHDRRCTVTDILFRRITEAMGRDAEELAVTRSTLRKVGHLAISLEQEVAALRSALEQANAISRARAEETSRMREVFDAAIAWADAPMGSDEADEAIEALRDAASEYRESQRAERAAQRAAGGGS